MSRRIALVGLSWISADLAGAGLGPDARHGHPVQPRLGRGGHPRSSSWSPAATSRRRARDTFLRPLVGPLPGPQGLRRLRARCSGPSARSSSPSSRPDHLHRGVVEVAIEAGARGIFCEKPIATTLEDADAIVGRGPGGGRDDERQLHPALVPRVRRGAPDRPRAARSAGCRRSSSRWAARARCCSATTPTPSTWSSFLADSEPRLGLGRARARVRGLRHRLRRRRRQRPGHRARRQLLHRLRQRRPGLPDRVEGHGRPRHRR